MKKTVWLLSLTILLAMAGYFSFLQVGDWLAQEDSLARTDIIICHDGSAARLAKAAELWHKGYAPIVVVTTSAACQQLLAWKVPAAYILQANWSATTTYQEGLLLDGLLSGRGYRSALVVSDPYHLLRVKWTLGQLLRDRSLRLSFVAADGPATRAEWWKQRESRLFVLSEIPKLMYYWLWHGQLGIAEDPPWAVTLKRWYARQLQALV